jgi:MFS family permease
VAKWFVRRRGRALALAGAGLGIGGIVLLPVTQWLIDGYGWRGTWRILALLFLVISVPSAALFLRRQPEDMGLRVDGDPPETSSTSGPHTSARGQPNGEVMWTVREAFRTGTMWKLVAVFALSGVAQGGSSFHRIPYFVEKGYDPLVVSWSFAADAGGAAATSLVAGWLADRVPTRFLAAASFSGFIIAILVMIHVSSVQMMFLSTIIFGSSVGIGMIVHTYIFAAYYGRAFLGTIRGIVMPINLLTAGLGAPLVGYLHDYSGSYLLAWWTLLGIYGCTAALMLTATPPRKMVGVPG